MPQEADVFRRHWQTGVTASTTDVSNPDRLKTWQWHEILNGGATTVVRSPLCRNPEAVDLTEAKYLLYEGDWSPGLDRRETPSFSIDARSSD
jgi:hypothetical protein